MTERWVDGWDDPRLMTLAGLRRRGVTSTSINAFVRGIGITRRLTYSLWCLFRSSNNIKFYHATCAFVIDINATFCHSDSSMIRLDRLEFHIREELNKTAPRMMVVLHPLKVHLSFEVVFTNHFISAQRILSLVPGCYYQP